MQIQRGKMRWAGRPMASSALWTTLQSTVILGGTAVVTAFAARHYGPEVLGQLNFAMALATLLTALATLGMEPVVIKFLAREPEQRQKIMTAASRLRVVAGLGAAVIATLLGLTLANGEIAHGLALIFAGTLVVRSPEILLSWYRATHRMGPPALLRIGTFCLTAALRLQVLHADASIIIYGLTYLLEASLYAVAISLDYRRRASRTSSTKPAKTANSEGGYWGLIFRNSIPLAISGLAVSLYSRIDQIMLGAMRGSYDVGLYAAAVQISEMWYFIPMAAIGTLVPVVMRREQDLASGGLTTLYGLVLSSSTLLAMSVAALAGPVVRVLYGELYLEATQTLRLLSVASILAMCGVSQGAWLVAVGLQRYSILITGTGAAVNIGLNFALIPRWGGEGAALATIASQVVAVIIIPLVIPQLRPAIRGLVGGLNVSRTAHNLRLLLREDAR